MTTIALPAIPLPRTAAPRSTSPAAVPTLPQLPASAHLVYAALSAKGALTSRDLLDETGLPARTVRYAVRRLREARLVDHRYNLADARQSYYYVNECPDACAVAPRRVL